MTAASMDALITQALKVLNENKGPEQRYKRERIYEMWDDNPRVEEFLRRNMGDTDGDRDTRNGNA